MTMVNTVTGPISSDDLGPTLMHEHLVIGFAGYDTHTTKLMPRAEMVARCIERVGQLQELGFQSIVDPCPSDLGRDVSVMVEVAEATKFNVICATGLYKEEEGATAHWKYRSKFNDVVGVMAEVFTGEITDGVGQTGVKPGIIKVATGPNQMTDYERNIFLAAAQASVATGTPITTHTDLGTVGDLQQELLTGEGVPAQRIVIGHSCGTSDHEYHWKLASGGSYLGFDRFGIEGIQPDAERVKALVTLIERGAGDRAVVSHDSVWCMLGEPFPPEMMERMQETLDPRRFSTVIVPQMMDAGITQAQIDALLIDNPRRFFAQEELPAL